MSESVSQSVRQTIRQAGKQSNILAASQASSSTESQNLGRARRRRSGQRKGRGHTANVTGALLWGLILALHEHFKGSQARNEFVCADPLKESIFWYPF